ncbi:hypothetical protein PV10_04020 [Exophiala mesophila]|uniref:Uncharacterized protein n=1 Tax=Exophiala mesophila TaxID=212818 RepID=A0A0D1XWY3_EXOME|nr:uncharacterized protein PV10_04020 [Exophiala mesophila]KIV92751.1 hypothetical protein PV10_04020 [Exophiala mesophila]
MSSRLVTVTLQGAVLAALSNIIAQGLTAYQSTVPYSFDYTAFLHMVLLAIIQTPPNYKWQIALENNFPGYPPKRPATTDKDKDERPPTEETQSLSVTNTVIKFILDQTFGAVVNNVMFLVGISLLRGAGLANTINALQRDFWTMLKAGYAFWPFVTLTNLLVVPVEQRMLVGSLAGLAWGVFVNLLEL